MKIFVVGNVTVVYISNELKREFIDISNVLILCSFVSFKVQRHDEAVSEVLQRRSHGELL